MLHSRLLKYLDEVARLAGTEGVTTHEFTRLRDPLAPDAAARLAAADLGTGEPAGRRGLRARRRVGEGVVVRGHHL